MAVIARTDQVTIEAWQTEWHANKAKFHVKAYRNGTYFWGGAIWSGGVRVRGATHLEINGEYVTNWAAPKKSSWKWDGSVYYLMYNGRQQVLDWSYWAPQPGWIAANSIEYDREVSISRGSSRQGSKSVPIKVIMENGWASCVGSLTVYTSAINDVSGVSLSASVTDKSQTTRNITVSCGFTNPESYYTAYLYHGGTLLGSSRSGFSKSIPVTYAMFSTNQTFRLVIKGNDGKTYVDKSTSVYIEPSGVGIWYKQSGSAKEVFHVYYKNSSGRIIEVTEAWYRRNNINIKTVK